MSLVTTPEVRNSLKCTPFLGNTTGVPIWQQTGSGADLQGVVNGYRSFVTNQLPKNLGAGTNEHALLFGDFSQAILGLWDGVEVIVDPYTRAKFGEYVVVARQLYDIAVRQPKGFVKLTGILSTGL